jgi:hypothetical protein
MRSVTITEHTLEGLMARKDVVGAVPMLRTLAKQSKPKTDCCGRSSSRRQGLRQARTRLVGLPQNQKDYLKKVLNADELVVFIPSKGGSRKVVL